MDRLVAGGTLQQRRPGSQQHCQEQAQADNAQHTSDLGCCDAQQRLNASNWGEVKGAGRNAASRRACSATGLQALVARSLALQSVNALKLGTCRPPRRAQTQTHFFAFGHQRPRASGGRQQSPASSGELLAAAAGRTAT